MKCYLSFFLIACLALMGLSAHAQQADSFQISKVSNSIWKGLFNKPEAFNLLTASQAKPQTAFLEKLVPGNLPFNPSDIKVTLQDGKTYLRFPLQKEEQIYGFGLNFKTINQRGNILRLHVDHYGGQDNGRDHAPVPFFVSSLGYGVLINSARYLDVYVGTAVRKDSKNAPLAKNRNTDTTWDAQPYSDNLEILIPAAGVECYFFAGPTMMNVVQRFNLFCGGGALPPKWGLGFWFRTLTNQTDKGALQIADEFREKKYPLDVIGLEPGWQTKSYPCSFDWNPKLFPQPDSFAQALVAKGVRLNLWLNPYVSPDASVFKSIEPYTGTHKVWNGLVADYTLPEARKIMQDHFSQKQIGIGISGFKVDEVDGYDNWLWPDVASFPSGKDGEQMRQTYGVQMMTLFDEVFKQKNERTYGLIRAANAGSVSHPYVIYNDNYNHRDYITGLINAGFSGLLWTPEVRTGGSSEDWIRRMQTVCFSPLAMVNSWSDGLMPWAFKDVYKQCLDAANLRMQLLPYLYSSFAQYHFEGKPPFRAMNLVDSFQSSEAVVVGQLNSTDNPYAMATKSEIKDQYMMGDFILVAPLFEGEKERKVVLPKGNWYNFYTGELAGNGSIITIKADLDQIPLFVAEGAVIPMVAPISNTGEWKNIPLNVRVYGKSAGSFLLYDDDGVSFNYEQEKYSLKKLQVKKSKGKLTGEVLSVKQDGGWSYTTVNWQFMTK